jgi:predicted RNA-binding protein YlqC (UPF0109 family)
MEKVFKHLTIDEFLLSLNEFDNPDLIKIKLSEFVIDTFDGQNFMLKTKPSDKGKLITNSTEKVDFIDKMVSFCESREKYELCAELTRIRKNICNE